MGCDDGFADGEAKTVAAVGGGAGFVGAEESLEESRQILRRDAGAGVADGEHGGGGFRMGGHADFSAVPVVVDGIAQEVRDDLADAVGVAMCRSGREFAVELDVPSGGERTDEFDAGDGGFGEIEGRVLERFLSGIEAGKLEE